MTSNSLILFTPRLILIPTTLAITSPAHLSLYASLYVDPAFCLMGSGPSLPAESSTREETRQKILTRDIARSWETRDLGDFAVCMRSGVEVNVSSARELAGAPAGIRVVEGVSEAGFTRGFTDAEWVGYAGVREASTTCMPARTASNPVLPAWQEMVELQYGVAPLFWGKSLAREAAEAIMQWAGRERGVTRFIAETERANEKSTRVLEKSGVGKRAGIEYCKEEGEVEWEREFVSECWCGDAVL
ncbi:uncharacterized protein SETTUDRAFT_31864 [Exserohilum turcica Et28A]|uniref:N-acetyltransferase domain-containing protein n=1 Tax=Exserohilum turcicum (strain 28A) TaxID=671987 RepID=R0IHF8_EXST2|nr:uncharacterized protein SETTUDRAFT_31864 [Exserohilum turcica Et28A]EOA84605.1 hypothetical protein SETTUDRAFT_31864 [Exserohilum turcica Et28A]